MDGLVLALVVQPDGKVLIGGEFTSVNGRARVRVARLHGTGLSGSLSEPHCDPDGTFGAIVRGESGRSYSIQVSSDLANWAELLTLVATSNGVPDYRFESQPCALSLLPSRSAS